MAKTNSLRPHPISVLHYCSARKITISYQMEKLRTEGSLQYRAGNGRRRNQCK
jgi:hypothetical protein